MPFNSTVVWLTWRQVFANRRLYLAVLFSLLPFVIALLFRSFSADVAGDSRGFYLLLQREIVVGTLLPLAALVFGTTAFGGEVDDGTLLYLLVKPVPRWRVVLSKYLVAALSAFVLMIPAVLLPWLAIRGDDLPFAIPVAFVWGIAVAAAIYGALFTLLGLIHKQALVIGLMYVVVFEAVVSRQLPGVRSFSVREFAHAVTLHTADAALNLGAPLLTLATVRWSGGMLLVGALAIAVWKLARFQMTEKL